MTVNVLPKVRHYTRFRRQNEEVCHLWHTYHSQTVPQQLRSSIFRAYILPVCISDLYTQTIMIEFTFSSTRLIQPHQVLFTSLYRLQLPIENDLSGVKSFCTTASDDKSVYLFLYDGIPDTVHTPISQIRLLQHKCEYVELSAKSLKITKCKSMS